MNKRNMKIEQIADHIGETMMESHRGAIPWTRNAVIAYGNDCYSKDKRSQAAVEHLREGLKQTRFIEIAFGTDSDRGLTWAMQIAFPCEFTAKNVAQQLSKAVWAGWFSTFGVWEQELVND
jgi:hypothetical protein